MWSLYKDGEFLKPLEFSNGKTQEGVVKEVLDSIKDGQKIIFIKGICGTGKSAIALNIARKMGKSSVVVPGKTLQAQYQKDYEGDKYVLKDKGNKLRIRVITGRNNHKCKFLEDNERAIPKVVKEVNSKLNDIFEGKRDEIKETIGKDISADNPNIPCKIEIKEKNWNRIKKYLKQNKKVNVNNFSEINDVKRVSVASLCPYWSPVFPEIYEFKILSDAKKRKYQGLGGTEFVFYRRNRGCEFYEQFNSYIDADVIVFNSLKYKLESALSRKPLTEVEIIDECDEFLDSFSNQRTVNIDRLQNSLIRAINDYEKADEMTHELQEILKQIRRNCALENFSVLGEIIPIKKTGIYDLFKSLLDCPEFLEGVDEENYVFEVEESARMFEDFFEDSYVIFSKREDNIIASVITTNLAKKFKGMVEKNKVIVLMSGTIHSENVLRDIFGLDDFKIIEAETKPPGEIDVKRTGKEIDCRHSKLNGRRREYIEALDKCVGIAERPVLVHVNAFSDLPAEDEIREIGTKNLISREKIREMQNSDKKGGEIRRFKEGYTDVLFSTRCSRGVDFPGEECKSIVFTKYPNPNIEDAFWKILRQTKPQHYWEFYKDKARRELWQKIYRGLRFKEDHVFVLSPDVRVLEVFESMPA